MWQPYAPPSVKRQDDGGLLQTPSCGPHGVRCNES